MNSETATGKTREGGTIPAAGAAAAVLLLALLAAQLLYTAYRTSATDDEPYCIVSGLTALRTGDYRFNVDHPPLMAMILGAAAHLAGAAPLPLNQDWRDGLRMKYSYFYLWTGPNAPKAVGLVTAARLPVIALSLALAWLVFVWARQLWGWRGALLSLALYSFEPNLIAHSSVATLDFGLTAAFCFALYAFWRYLRTGGFLYLALTGAAVGAAATIKLPGLLLVLVLPTLIFAARTRGASRRWPPGPRARQREENPLTPGAIREETRRRRLPVAGALAAIFGFALVFMWAVYRFSFAPVSSEAGASFDALRPALSPAEGAGLRVPLGQYWQAIAFQLQHQGSGHPAFLLGMVSTRGWWYYYPVAFLVKTSLPLLILLGLAFSRGKLDRAVARGSLAASGAQRRADERFLVIPALLFFGAAMVQGLDLGIRYLLPVYPLLILLVGRTLARPWPAGWGAWPRRAVLALVVWAAAEAISYAPSCLAYFNELVGGPSHGGAVLADSNLDWGQDLRSLAAWQRKHPKASPLHFAYFGPAEVSRYGVRCERLPDLGPKDPPRPPDWYQRESRPRAGWIAISVNCLKLLSAYRWLESYQPVDRAGYSILIYHVPVPAGTQADRGSPP